MIALIIIAAVNSSVVTLDAANHVHRRGPVGCLCSKSNKPSTNNFNTAAFVKLFELGLLNLLQEMQQVRHDLKRVLGLALQPACSCWLQSQTYHMFQVKQSKSRLVLQSKTILALLLARLLLLGYICSCLCWRCLDTRLV